MFCTKFALFASSRILGSWDPRTNATARELAEKMIQTVKNAEKDYIFALSVEPKMFEFFKSLGFKECERSVLPESWRDKYDMSRQSRAFKLNVKD